MAGVSFGSLRQLFHGNEPQQAARAQPSPKPLTGMVPVAPEARAAMQRAGDGSRRSRLLKHVTMEKQRREVAAMSRQWAQRTMASRQASAPAADALSGFGKDAQQLLARHPLLCQQLHTLQAQGWAIGDQNNMREGDLRARHHIAINPELARHQPAIFLSTLARHCGAAMHDQPLSLSTAKSFELGFLENEAAGALNVIALSRTADASGKPPKLVVDAPMIRAYEALRAENGDVTPSPADMAARVHAEFDATGQLGMRASGQRRERLADDMQRQYQAFGIQDNSPPPDVARVEQCFNRTGVAHAASKLAAFATNDAGASHWLARKNLAGMIHRGAGGFTRLGIADSQIGPLVEHALASGQYRQLDDKNFAVTCHDTVRDQAVQLYVTHGDKPGEIKSVLAGTPGWGHFVRDAAGRERWLNLAHCDPALNGLAAQACATHGIDPQFLPEVIHTAMLTGRATELPADPGNPGVTRAQYQFTYRHQPMSAVLHSQQGNDYLTGVEITPRAASPVLTAAGAVAPDIATRMGNAQWQQMAAQAARFELPPSALLERVAKPENMLMPSVEHAGFFQFRTQIAGQSVSLLARMENGTVVDARLPSEFDRILQSCPTQEEHLRGLQRQGWQIGMGNNGEGIYCDQGQKRIALGDPGQISAPGLFDVLVHEMAHARYTEPVDMTSEDAYAACSAANEGNSLLSEFEALEHFSPGPGRDQHLAYLAKYPTFTASLPIYERMQQAIANASTDQERGDARLAAQTAMGQIYAKQNPSTDPHHVTYDMRWRSFHREYHGADTKFHRVQRLAQEQPKLKVEGTDGQLEAPSISNINNIAALPPRPDGALGKRSDHLFITSATLLEQSQGHDMRVFQNVVASAMNHCGAQIEPVGSDAEQATYRFNLQGQGHEVAMRFGSTGKVFSIQHSTSALWDAAPAASIPVTAPTS